MRLGMGLGYYGVMAHVMYARMHVIMYVAATNFHVFVHVLIMSKECMSMYLFLQTRMYGM